MKELRILLEAKEEMIASAKYYDKKAPDLGNEFLDEINRIVDEIAISPNRWPIIESNIRRVILKRFPYSIFYIEKEKEIIILAIAHQKRRGYYWKKRI